jgi:alpha-beta hydrolase superfamily lysophospholipase
MICGMKAPIIFLRPPNLSEFILFLFTLSFACASLPVDPTTTKREELLHIVPRLSVEKPGGGLLDESELLREYQAHFDFTRYIPEDLDYSHFLGQIEWKKNETVGINFFKIRDPHGHLVLFHGFLGSQALWRSTLGHFLKQGFNVVLVDLPGHGFATGIRGAIDNFDDYGLLIRAALDWYRARVPGQDGLILGGHSTGATGIIQYLKSPTHKIEGIFMVNPLLHHVYWGVGQFAAWLLQGLAPYHKPLFTPDAYLGPSYFPASWPVRLGEWNSRLPRVIETEIPLLIHQGTSDEVVDFYYNIPRMKELFPKATIIMRRDLGHTSLQDGGRARIILDDIQIFLDEIQEQERETF